MSFAGGLNRLPAAMACRGLRGSPCRRIRRGKSPAEVLISRYIFPGGALDHISMSIGNLELAGFEVHDVEGVA